MAEPILKLIGQSSPTSTRISVVANEDQTIARLVTRQGNSGLQSSTLDLGVAAPFRLGSFDLDGLAPDVPIEYALDTATDPSSLADEDTIWGEREIKRVRLPRQGLPPRFGFLSCNGFHTVTGDRRMVMWERLKQVVDAGEVDHLIHGGDQIYADPILQELELAGGLPELEAIKRRYRQWYVMTWSREPIRHVLASCPSVMMWDDHDIFDGWGSHDEVSPLTRRIFEAAHGVFGEFQARHNPARLGQHSYASAFELNEVGVLMLDGRTNRSYKDLTVIGKQQWADVDQYLQQAKGLRYLLVIAGVPVIHVDIAAILGLQETTPWTEASTDDLRDSWIAKNNRAEARRLMMRLFRFQAENPKTQVAILSGDVHVGSLGRIRSEVPAHDVDRRIPTVFQVVSSGIAYKAPSGLEAWVLRRVTGGQIRITPDIYGELLPLDGVSGRLLAQRNFAIVCMTDDGEQTWDEHGNLYVTYYAEGADVPLRQVLHRI